MGSEAKTCADCAHARTRFMCARGEKPYRQAYERQYTDSDFCGPNARYFKAKDHPNA